MRLTCQAVSVVFAPLVATISAPDHRSDHPQRLFLMPPAPYHPLSHVLRQCATTCQSQLLSNKAPSSKPLQSLAAEINRSVSAGSGTAGDLLPASSPLVFGASTVGMLTATALSVVGIAEVVIPDIDTNRLATAAERGGGRYKNKTHLLARRPPASSIEALANAKPLAEELNTAFEVPTGFSRVVEYTSMPPCVQMGISAAAAGGQLVLVGMGTPVQTLPLGAAAL